MTTRGHSSKHAKRSAASTREHSAPPGASYVPEGGTGDNTARAQASCTTHSTPGFMGVSACRRGSESARGPRTYLARMLGCRSVPRSRRSHRRSSRRRLSKSAAPTSGRQRSSAPASVFGCLWSRGQLLGCATEARSPLYDVSARRGIASFLAPTRWRRSRPLLESLAAFGILVDQS